MKRLACFLLTLILLGACSHSQSATSGNADVIGACKAQDGSVLPGVTVTLRGNGDTRSAVTDAQGQYRFPNVKPGHYEVTFELTGFGAFTRKFRALPGKSAIVMGKLNPSLNEVVTVTAEAAQISRKNAPYFDFDSFEETQITPGSAAREHDFKRAAKDTTTTFSIDVDKASYAIVRRALNEGETPEPEDVRIEEMVNYFPYHYPQPNDGRPFSITSEVTGCPWNAAHRLMRVGIQARSLEAWKLAPNNLVFLLDVSGSMDSPERLPLIKSALHLLVEQLRGEDTVAIVFYAGAAGLVLEPTPGSDKAKILAAIDKLQAGGSTAGSEGIRLAYKVAKDAFLTKGNNRVILATDGDFNVGVSSFDDLTKLIEEQRYRNIYLTCLGVGSDNLQDGKIQLLADKGNGNYYYLDSLDEAKKVFQRNLAGTLVTVADDVKVQLTFDPTAVASYRQIGYENRAMKNEDFLDDAKDAGELGSGDAVTVLYEIEPLRTSGTIATLKVRYKEPGAWRSREVAASIADEGKSAYEASADMQFAAAIAEFGMLLRDSKHKGTATWADAAALARATRGEDLDGDRSELLELLERAGKVSNVATK